jgi:serine/threonine protein phosphatase PrpC
LATETIRDYFEAEWNSQTLSTTILKQALTKANEAILQGQKEHPQWGDMGTTVVATLFRDLGQGDKAKNAALYCGHVGDSRLYRLRGKLLEQITEDHTLVNQVLRSGLITPEQARSHPLRHVLSQCLGRSELKEVTVQACEIIPGDRLLICSDGLTEELSDDLIQKHLATEQLQYAVERLIEAAKAHGGRDNITVVAMEVTADE